MNYPNGVAQLARAAEKAGVGIVVGKLESISSDGYYVFHRPGQRWGERIQVTLKGCGGRIGRPFYLPSTLAPGTAHEISVKVALDTIKRWGEAESR